MGTYHQADDEISVRSPRGSVVCQSMESPRRPTSVVGLMTSAGEPMSMEDNVRRRVGDPLKGSRTQLMERRPCSVRPYEGPGSGRSSRLAELQSGEVDGSVDDPGDSTVLYAVNRPRKQSKLHGLSSRGAWEGRLRPRGRGTSVYCGECRRWRTSSSSSGDGSGGEQSPLATPLPGEGSVHGEPHHTTPRQGHWPMERSMEVMRNHELQPGTSAGHASVGANAGQGSMPAPSRHVSVGANAGLGSVPAPPARRAEELMSEQSDDAEESGELSEEVHSILSSRDGVRQGIRSGNGQAGGTVRQRYDDPSEFQAGGDPGNRARGWVEPRAFGLGPHHVLWGRTPEKNEDSRRTQHHAHCSTHTSTTESRTILLRW